MRAIVSFANERGNYIQALKRLEDSVAEHDKSGAAFFGFIGEDSIGAPKHEDNPYAFKIYAIDEVRKQGYTSILWLDSSCVVRKDLTPAFYLIERYGYIMQEAGCFVGDWCNDETLDAFVLPREQAMKMLCYGNAGFLGLNFQYGSKANAFYAVWKISMMAGLFKGSWDNHRHDLTCGSIIANMYNFRYVKGDEWLQYSAPDAPLINDTILISAQGM